MILLWDIHRQICFCSNELLGTIADAFRIKYNSKMALYAGELEQNVIKKNWDISSLFPKKLLATLKYEFIL